jgi:hypothetical protein
MARNYRSEYENYQGSPSQIKRRSSRNKARRKMIKAGRAKVGDGKDVGHKSGNPLNNSEGNLKMQTKKSNRSYPRTKSARKKFKGD